VTKLLKIITIYNLVLCSGMHSFCLRQLVVIELQYCGKRSACIWQLYDREKVHRIYAEL